MSPMYLDEKLGVDRVAIIGAGPCGLAMAKYLLAEKKFAKIEVFEQRASVGGVWNYTPLNVIDNDFTVPRTHPTKLPDTAVRTNDSETAQFVSPVYEFLETNIPHSLMNFADQAFPSGSSLFPKHAVVKQYLTDYAAELQPYLTLQTQILDVCKSRAESGKSCWELQILDLKSDQKRKAMFDAVVVASGHYNDPYIPDIKGLAEFNETHPGAVSHSKFYRRPDQYKDRKVIVVGNSASGIDISAQVGTVCKRPIIVSEKSTPATPVEKRAYVKSVPEIVEVNPETRSVRFADGDVETDVDAIVFCTGYFYSYPFLKSLSPSVVTDGSCARNLYEHVLYIDDPTLAFLGIPQRVVPFPIAEVQSAWVSRIWADRLSIPPADNMRKTEEEIFRAKGARAMHNMAFPQDADYINRLHDAAVSARQVQGLDNEGKGKIPPFWGEDKRWARERFPMIKIASRALGDKRHEIHTLKELGFDYEAWKAVDRKMDRKNWKRS